VRSGLGGAVLVIAVALLLRSTALSVLASRGVVLDVLVFVVALWAMRRGEVGGTLLGFAIGIAADLDAHHWLGRQALALSLIGYCIGRLGHTLVRDRTRTHLVVLAIATAVHQIWATAFELAPSPDLVFMVRRAVLAAVFTAPAGALVLAITRRLYGRSIFPNARLGTGPTG